MIELNTVNHMDIFDLCATLPDKSVDMILADLPYGVHEAVWDSIIPIVPMWDAFKRIIKPRGAIVLTCVMGFAWQLIAANPEMFKYDWVGMKNIAADFLNAHNKPMRAHENILVFSDGTTANRSPNRMPYYPQLQAGDAYTKIDPAGSKDKSPFGGMGRAFTKNEVVREKEADTRLPNTLLTMKRSNFEGNLHPNQKDVNLFRYLIRTYTRPGELVFDPCVGSGTTAIAARAEGRNYIVGDFSAEYVQVARDRLALPYTPMFTELL